MLPCLQTSLAQAMTHSIAYEPRAAERSSSSLSSSSCSAPLSAEPISNAVARCCYAATTSRLYSFSLCSAQELSLHSSSTVLARLSCLHSRGTFQPDGLDTGSQGYCF